jgi:hypothetical protein
MLLGGSSYHFSLLGYTDDFSNLSLILCDLSLSQVMDIGKISSEGESGWNDVRIMCIYGLHITVIEP